jgi:hypothetical protein
MNLFSVPVSYFLAFSAVELTMFFAVSFWVFIVVIVQFVVFWIVALCYISGEYQRFGGIFCFHLQGRF